jgi:hypothetical protein
MSPNRSAARRQSADDVTTPSSSPSTTPRSSSSIKVEHIELSPEFRRGIRTNIQIGRTAAGFGKKK